MTEFESACTRGRAWPSRSRTQGEAFGGAKGEPEMRSARRVIGCAGIRGRSSTTGGRDRFRLVRQRVAGRLRAVGGDLGPRDLALVHVARVMAGCGLPLAVLRERRLVLGADLA